MRPKRTFEEAAEKYLEEHAHKPSIWRDGYGFQGIMPYIGKLQLSRLSNDSLNRYKRDRLKKGISPGTINRDLTTVRRVLNLAARVWRDEHGLSWLVNPPLIEKVDDSNPREPYPLTWEEQAKLFSELPAHLERMALFKVNTGTRDGEVCNLRWEWEIEVPELDSSVFLIPREHVKNRAPRLVVLNSIARRVVEDQRGTHPEYVFTYRGTPVARMLTTAWKRARKRAGLPTVRVHDLKHTYGARLRACGVSFEDRQDLLGHKSMRITTHYSAPDIERLLSASERVTVRRKQTVLRVVGHGNVPRKTPPGCTPRDLRLAESVR